MSSRQQPEHRFVLIAASLGLLTFATPSTDAHHSIASFDTDTAITIRGKLRRTEISAPHSYLFVEQQTDDGIVEWAVEGPAPNQLARRGIGEGHFAEGDAIEACGYALREGVTGAYSGRRVLVAEVLVTADGRARLWSPYGQERCRDRNVYVIVD